MADPKFPPNLRAKNDIPPQPRKQLIAWHVNTTATTSFTDHNKQPAVSIYYGRSPSPNTPILPPLWSFQFYVTYGATADEWDETVAFKLLDAAMRAMHESYPMRLDINFLPGASVDECIAHYRVEKTSRTPLLPFPDPYWEYGNFSFLVMLEDADWETKGCTTVSFDGNDPEEGPGRVGVKKGVQWGELGTFTYEERYLGMVLLWLRPVSWGEGNDKYDEQLAAGRSDWG